MRKEIAIVGYGRFGRFAARHLMRHFSIVVSDTNPSLEPQARFVPIEEAAQKQIVVLAVPINKVITVLKSIAPHVGRNTLVIDVCSVKERPIEWMRKYLPRHASILGTHPLFGPDSAARTLRGRTIVLCPVKIPSADLACIEEYLRKVGIVVHRISPAEHDKLMASTLFLTQLVGRSLAGMQLPESIIVTQNYRLLQHVGTTTERDTIELFRDMYRYNRFTRNIPQKLIQQIEQQYWLLTHRSA